MIIKSSSIKKKKILYQTRKLGQSRYDNKNKKKENNNNYYYNL